jgi:hypothetical protein
MQTKPALPCAAVALALLLAINIPLPTAFAQGSLAPPGAPGPTMLTLSQIAPRTPISSVPFNITQPGSYYLTGNLTVGGGNAITIATNGVTLDLSGFTISSTAASANSCGILINSALQNITVANGFIRGGVTNNGSGVYNGGGFLFGLYYTGNAPVNVLVSRVSVSGCLDFGIFLNIGDSTVVESCTVRTVGNSGICASTVKGSAAVDCGATAIYGDQVSDCHGQCTGSGDGIDATATALNCYGSSSNYAGIVASTAMNCYGTSGSGDGIDAESTALNCQGSSNGNGIGVYGINVENCYGYSGSYFAIYTTAVLNSYGISSSNDGILASIAENCCGQSNGNGDGINATSVQNCFGVSSGSGDGIFAGQIASGCYGYSNSGFGVSAFIASLCHGATVTGTALSTSHNVNSF